ncbi:uncharacterized protein B0I36DRAFT_98933 [Microdochium trichocladiopsis]|uniref:Uncharacterized protein n=1 Tax=Microdochium trichocladiopsis TaxID=1682393 RepID=A0A9P8YAL7_9PEZI|nr:uncharacterized protein B0I36DRAFT_98933 [Microdochium trichocladiopsis]KAH7032588.1 hypothetical protein B0I36DRAFT_98933 [Microdochium trichocladiopsis]
MSAIASAPNTADQDGGVLGTVSNLASHHNTASTSDGATLCARLKQLLSRAEEVLDRFSRSRAELETLEEIFKQGWLNIREQTQAGDTKARSPQSQGQDSDTSSTDITSNIQTATSNEVSASSALRPRRVAPASDRLLSPNMQQQPAAAASNKEIAPINDTTETQPAAPTVEKDQQANSSDGGAADTLQQHLSCGQVPSSSAPTPDDGSASSSEDGSTPATSPDSGCASNNTTTEGTEGESMTDTTTHASSNLHEQRDGVGMSTNVEAQVSTNAVATTGDKAIEPARTADDTPTTPDPLGSGSDLNRPGDKDLPSGVADEHRGRAHEPSDEQSNPGVASSGDATIMSNRNVPKFLPMDSPPAHNDDLQRCYTYKGFPSSNAFGDGLLGLEGRSEDLPQCAWALEAGIQAMPVCCTTYRFWQHQCGRKPHRQLTAGYLLLALVLTFILMCACCTCPLVDLC